MSKDFKTPSMNFISPETIARVDGQPEEREPRIMGQGAQDQPQEAPADNIRAWKTADSNGKNRKTILEVPDGYAISDALIEKRTKRVNVLLQPSIYERMKAQADLLGVSFNEIVNRAFAEYLER